MAKKKNTAPSQKANEVIDGKFTTTAPNCDCGTTMEEYYVAMWHDKYTCPRCGYFQGVPNREHKTIEGKK